MKILCWLLPHDWENIYHDCGSVYCECCYGYPTTTENSFCVCRRCGKELNRLSEKAMKKLIGEPADKNLPLTKTRRNKPRKSSFPPYTRPILPGIGTLQKNFFLIAEQVDEINKGIRRTEDRVKEMEDDLFIDKDSFMRP